MKKGLLFLLLVLSFVPQQRLFAEISVSRLKGMEGVQVNHENACAWDNSRLNYYCWGRSDGGLHGTNDYTEKGFVPYARRNVLNDLQGKDNHFISLSVGSNGACGVLVNGQALCWGPNYRRQGSGPRTLNNGRYIKGHYPSPVSHPGENMDDLSDDLPMTGFKSIELGNAREVTCGIREIQGVSSAWCWGSNFFGTLGDGNKTSIAYYPVQVMKGENEPLTDVASIHIEDLHICAITKTKGHVYCWGQNDSGTIGSGDLNNDTYTYANQVQISRDQNAEENITYLSEVKDMAVGRYHNCAIKGESEELWCWGSGFDGALGNGSPFSRSAFAIQAQESQGIPLTEVEDVALSQGVTCIIKNGRPMCLGQAKYGRLGNGKIGGPNAMYPEPVLATSTDGFITSLSSATSISANNLNVCTVAFDGQVYCWGRNTHLLLGNADTNDNITTGFAQKVLRIEK